jgi:hypothetical protein
VLRSQILDVPEGLEVAFVVARHDHEGAGQEINAVAGLHDVDGRPDPNGAAAESILGPSARR